MEVSRVRDFGVTRSGSAGDYFTTAPKVGSLGVALRFWRSAGEEKKARRRLSRARDWIMEPTSQPQKTA